MDVDLPISHSPSVTSPSTLTHGGPPSLSTSTPRRHLKQLSLAPGSLPTRSIPASPAATSPLPRSFTDGSFTPSSSTPSSSQPTSPSPLSRAGSLGRNPRRQSSISYSPSYRTQSFALGQSQGGPSTLAGSPLGLGLGNLGGRPSLEGRRSVSEIGSGERSTASSSLDGEPRPDPSSSGTPARSRIGSASVAPPERDPADMTLAEKHSDLLSYIAQKESRSLELRESLAQNESELALLKRKWTSIVSRGAGRPSPSAAHAPLPITGSMPASASSALLGTSAEGGGLLGPEALQSGKRFLSSLLGVGEETDRDQAAVSSHGGGAQPLKESNGTSTNVPKAAPSRSSLDILASVSRSGLEMVTESLEDPSSPPSKHRPLSHSSSPVNRSTSSSSSLPSSTRSKRLSMMSSTSSSSTQSTAPSSLDLGSSSNRGSSQGGSIDSTSSSSSLFSLTPTDERASWVGADTERLAGIGEEAAVQNKKDARSLVDDMASSTGSAGLAGWGRRWGDLATAMTGNESFQSSKRATLSLASTFQTTLNTLASPPPHATSHPLSSPNPSHPPSSSSLFPLSPTPKSKPKSPAAAAATKMKTLDSPWDALGESGGLQEPLVPVGRSPSPRIGPVSPAKKANVAERKKEVGAVAEDDGWNW